jgi:prevent-host-death family protein
MKSVASRELRNKTRAVLEKVEAGQSVAITVDGRTVATLEPIDRAQRWMRREEFATRILGRQADSALRADLDALAPDTTDELDRR